MKKRKLLTAFICVLLAFLMTGCFGLNTKTEKGKTEVILNERQKELLRELGLPEEYDELTDSQKNGIVKIERVLCYLEEKYDDEFEYDGYVSGGVDGEYVMVTVKDSCPAKYVEVDIRYENGEYIYSDNYEEKMAEDEYVKEATEFLSAYFKPEDFQVYINISRLREEGTSVMERAAGRAQIFVNSVYDEDYVEKTAKAYVEWVLAMPYSDGCGADFRITKTEIYEEINAFNYKDYYGDQIAEISIYGNSEDGIEVERYYYGSE